MQHLLNQLNSRNPAIRDAALRAARVLPPEAMLKLLLLESHSRRIRRRQGFVFYGFIVYASVFLGQKLHIPKDGLQGIYQCLCLFVATMWQNLYAVHLNRASRQIIKLMSEVEDNRFIAPMLRLQDALPQNESQELRTGLKRLLPQVRADHAPQWSKEDKAALLLPLKNPTNDSELTVACLKALEQIGDTSALPAVKKVANQAYQSNSKSLRRAAEDCLLYLERNADRFQQAETLLRASETATMRPDILLRPAQSASDSTPAEQLLRPGG